MSNSLAIAAVTTTLQSLINQGVRNTIDSVTVTTLTLEKAQANSDGNQINLLLYHVMPKLELGRQQTQPRGKPKNNQKASLALDLYYLLVAYGEKENEAKSHVLLGQVVQVLYDCAKLSPGEIEVATAREYPDSDLHRQLESIQITPAALSFEDMSKVWQVMGSPYRPSVAYKVSAVMIDSRVPAVGAMPVLARSGVGSGPLVKLGLPPLIMRLSLPNRQPSVRLGEQLKIQGEHLEGETVRVHLRHPLLRDPINLSPLSSSHASEVEIALPTAEEADAQAWLAGFWTVALEVQRADSMQCSNEFPLAMAPTVSNLEPLEAPVGNLSVTLTCTPAIRPEQRVMLLWGDRPIPAYQVSHTDSPAASSRLTYRIREIVPAVYPVRLRVDGVDSLPVDFSTVPWQIDPQQQVRITGQ